MQEGTLHLSSSNEDSSLVCCTAKLLLCLKSFKDTPYRCSDVTKYREPHPLSWVVNKRTLSEDSSVSGLIQQEWIPKPC